jgi:hypothetical protein
MRPRRFARVAAAATLAALLAPATASAHLRTGTVAVGFAARVTSPPSAAFSVGVYRSDLALHLTVAAGHTVAVRGYLGEIFLRIGPAGESVDDASPTAAAAGLIAKNAPRSGWTLRAGKRSATWHDTRVSQLRAAAASASWTIPIRVDGRPAEIAGVTRRLPAPPLWPWLALLALTAAATLVLVRLRGAARAALALGPLAAGAGAVTAVAFALDSYASPGTWIAGLDEIAFVGAGLLVLVFGPEAVRVGASIGIGLLGVAIGLSKGELFLRADVLSVLPAAPSRAVAAIAIGAGTAAAAAGGVALVRGEARRSPPRMRSSAG